MLKIKNLKAGIEEVQILKGINLEVKKLERYMLLWVQRFGKSTLSAVIAGKEDYEVEDGCWFFRRRSNGSRPWRKSPKGVFLSFQYPIEIPGISVSNFIKTSLEKEKLGSRSITSKDLLKMMWKNGVIKYQKGYLSRNMNEGFSGGEKKEMKFSDVTCWA